MRDFERFYVVFLLQVLYVFSSCPQHLVHGLSNLTKKVCRVRVVMMAVTQGSWFHAGQVTCPKSHTEERAELGSDSQYTSSSISLERPQKQVFLKWKETSQIIQLFHSPLAHPFYTQGKRDTITFMVFQIEIRCEIIESDNENRSVMSDSL